MLVCFNLDGMENFELMFVGPERKPRPFKIRLDNNLASTTTPTKSNGWIKLFQTVDDSF